MHEKISDLEDLKGLKQCSLSGFDIADKDMSIINGLPKLEFLELDFCNFKLVSESINNLKLENLYLDKCINFTISHINSSNLKSLSVVGCEDNINTLNLADLAFSNLNLKTARPVKSKP